MKFESSRPENLLQKKGKNTKKEYDLKKLKKVKRPGWANKDLKVVKTIRFDMDVVNWAVCESEKRGMPYQTFIKSVLKEAMNKGDKNKLHDEIRQIVKEELAKKAS